MFAVSDSVQILLAIMSRTALIYNSHILNKIVLLFPLTHVVQKNEEKRAKIITPYLNHKYMSKAKYKT